MTNGYVLNNLVNQTCRFLLIYATLSVFVLTAAACKTVPTSFTLFPEQQNYKMT